MPHPLWEEAQRKKAERVERRPLPREKAGVTPSGATFLAGATPLLVGLLTGEAGTGAEIAGKALVGEHERALKEENRLIDFLRKRRLKAAGGGAGPLYKVRGPEGAITYRGRAEAVDQPAPYLRRPEAELGRIKRQLRYKTVTNKLTGEKYQVPVGEPKPGEVVEPKKIEVPLPAEYPKGWTETKETLMQRTVKDYNTVFDKVSLNTVSLKKSYEGMGIGELGTKLGIMRLVKDIETRLSDADRDYYTKPVGASFISFRGMMTGLKRELTGKERATLVREAKALFRKAIEYSEKYQAGLGRRRLNQLEAAGVPRSYGMRRLGISKRPAPTPEAVAPPAGAPAPTGDITVSYRRGETPPEQMSIEDIDAEMRKLQGEK